jgi:hypothetical protein
MVFARFCIEKWFYSFLLDFVLKNSFSIEKWFLLDFVLKNGFTAFF